MDAAAGFVSATGALGAGATSAGFASGTGGGGSDAATAAAEPAGAGSALFAGSALGPHATSQIPATTSARCIMRGTLPSKPRLFQPLVARLQRPLPQGSQDDAPRSPIGIGLAVDDTQVAQEQHPIGNHSFTQPAAPRDIGLADGITSLVEQFLQRFEQ
jgi:hypothetical protein